MTRAVFETAALADAMTKAAKVAPTRGAAFDKAAGIVIDVSADEAVVMATDTLVRFSTWITPEEFEGEPVSWRLPSRVFAEVLGKLKTTQYKTLTLQQEGNILRLVHGRTRAQFMLMDVSYYPKWAPFSPDDMHEVDGLAKAISQVSWAAAKSGEPPFIGVRLDGEVAVASDKYKFSCSPCKIDIDSPIVIPPTVLTSVLSANGTVAMRIEGSQVYIMPDDFTQIALTAYGVEYPPIDHILKRTWPTTVKVQKQSVIDMIDLATTMTGADRMPTLVLIFGREEIAAMLSNQEIGLLGHVIETPGQLNFTSRVEIRFNPDNFIGALNGCPSSEVTLGFDHTNPYGAFYLNGGDGVEYWLAPRRKVAESA